MTAAAAACESLARMRGAPAAAVTVVAVLAAGAAWLHRPRDLQVEVGAFDHPFASGDWGRADRVDVEEAAAAGGPTSFYYRPDFSDSEKPFKDIRDFE